MDGIRGFGSFFIGRNMDKDDIKEALEQYDSATEAWAENYNNALDDLRFARLGEQWPDQVQRDRELEGRPCLTINRMPSFIRQVVNDSRQNKPSIKVHPADDFADPATAEVMNGLIRNIEYTSNADVAYDTALESAVSAGFGFYRISTDYAHDDSFDMDIRIERVANPFSITFDPSSMEADSSDWNFAFCSETYTHDAFKKKWKGAKATDFGKGDFDESWITEDTVRVSEWWTREEVDRKILKLSNGAVLDESRFLANQELLLASGLSVLSDRMSKTWKVRQRIITGAEVLEDNEWAGRYIPIIPVYGDEIIVEGKRYFLSLIRFAKDPQRMFNYWRTAATELVALAPKAPYVGPVGAFDTDANKWATANNKSHPYIEYDGEIPPQRQPFSGVPAGALQEAMNASDDMKSIMGLYDASLGARSNETSGKAILARQREGDVSTFHFIDNLSRSIRHAGRILIDLIPHVYSGERVVRVMGVDGTPENVQLGQEYQDKDGIVRMHDLASGKYDLVVDVGPSFTTKREEAAAQMTEMIRAYPQMAPLIGDILAKNMDWPEADEIAKRLKVMLPPQLKEQQGFPPEAKAIVDQLTQQLQQMQQAMQQGMEEFNKLRSEHEAMKNDTALESRKLDIEAYKAETERFEAQHQVMTPEQIQAVVLSTLQNMMTQQDISVAPQ